MPVHIIKSDDMLLIHAQLTIFYDTYSAMPFYSPISNLTYLNMFNRQVNRSSTHLLDLIREMGGDVQYFQTPEYLHIAIDFLPEELSAFTHFLNEIFTYSSFQLKRFLFSKGIYWALLLNEKDWKKNLGLQICHNILFSKHSWEQIFLSKDALRRINLAQITSFHSRTYRPNNSQLTIKGNINPYTTMGLLEKNIAGQPKSSKEVAPENQAVTIPGKRVFLCHIPESESPQVFLFSVAPAVSDLEFSPVYLINHVLYGFPDGRIYQAGRNFLHNRNCRINTEVIPIHNWTLIVNSLRLNPVDVEEFLLLAEQEKRKLHNMSLQRKEYLDALSYYLGKLQTDTANYANDAFWDFASVVSTPKRPTLPNHGDILNAVSLDLVNQIIENIHPPAQGGGYPEWEIAIIIGNADQLLPTLRIIKPEIIEIFEK